MNKLITKIRKNQTVSFFYGAIFLLIISLVVLIIAIKTQADTKRLYNYSATPSKPFGIGQEVHMGEVSLTIKKVSFLPGQPHFAAKPGQAYAVVDLSIKNLSEKPIYVSPGSDIYIKDSDGNVSYLTPFVVANPFHAGELPPGEQVSGQLSYLVSKNTTMKLYVDAIWSGGVLSFKLN
jgi:hypothetical protein